ncbi:hypothetical protein Glove_186g21 [Diversispora epigaea]|uniref:Uncharacterized protein n=1 Tax=Diversispora epigaea TaxID=1348612 RepID=A0A397IVB0_9GLOM|nr:hypothetical protein Glove_186g21 [Diversispora epigaea]
MTLFTVNLLDPPGSPIMNIDLPTSKGLTPNQKRDLLFNIKQPLELLIEEFNNNWWPLISNIWMGFNLKKKVNGDSLQTYTCRFTKHNPSSTRKEVINGEKQKFVHLTCALLKLKC